MGKKSKPIPKKLISDEELAAQLKWLPAAQDLAKMLGETKPSALEMLCKLLSHAQGDLGWLTQESRQAMEQCAAVTLRKDGQPRTRGGVFFEVARVSGKFPKELFR